MTRSPYTPDRHPVFGLGHWQGDVDAAGEVVDVFVRHCPTHTDHEAPCTVCRTEVGDAR